MVFDSQLVLMSFSFSAQKLLKSRVPHLLITVSLESSGQCRERCPPHYLGWVVPIIIEGQNSRAVLGPFGALRSVSLPNQGPLSLIPPVPGTDRCFPTAEVGLGEQGAWHLPDGAPKSSGPLRFTSYCCCNSYQTTSALKHT